MGRQLQAGSPPWRGVQTVNTPLKGGTGADNAVEAVQNLGGIHVSQVNQPNGIAGYDPVTGKLSNTLFNEAGVEFFGFSIQGPNRLAHNTTGAYRITDLSTNMEPVVSVSAGQAEINDGWLYVTAPSSGTEIVLSVGVRRITIQLVEPGVETPQCLYPINVDNQPSIVPSTFILRMSRFIAEPIAWTAWQELNSDTGGQSQQWLDSGAIAFEVEGRRGDNGVAWVKFGGARYDFGAALSNRVFNNLADTFFDYQAENGGSIRFRTGKSSFIHESTDWEIATDPEFTNLVFSSYEDNNSLTELTVTLPSGVNYYARARYNGRLETGAAPS